MGVPAPGAWSRMADSIDRLTTALADARMVRSAKDPLELLQRPEPWDQERAQNPEHEVEQCTHRYWPGPQIMVFVW